MYAGQAITVVAQATDPKHNAQITDALSHVDFFAPGKNPAKVPSDRTVVDEGPFPMTWDATIVNKDGTLGAYVAYVDTTDWPPGKWTYRVTLEGSYDAWAYGTVKLDP